MVNTLFMHPRTEVVEIWKQCGAWREFVYTNWTAWQAPLVGVRLAYVGCRYLKIGGVFDRVGPRVADVADILTAVESAVVRLRGRAFVAKRLGSIARNEARERKYAEELSIVVRLFRAKLGLYDPLMPVVVLVLAVFILRLTGSCNRKK